MVVLRLGGIALVIVLSALSLGCSTHLDRHWGDSQHSLTEMQIAHPNPEPASATLDGVTVEHAVEAHRQPKAGSDSPSTTPIMTLGNGS